MRRKPVSKPRGVQGMKQRVEVALGKAERGEELTKKELTIVQWVTRSGGCRVCSPRIRISHRREKDRRPGGGEC